MCTQNWQPPPSPAVTGVLGSWFSGIDAWERTDKRRMDKLMQKVGQRGSDQSMASIFNSRMTPGVYSTVQWGPSIPISTQSLSVPQAEDLSAHSQPQVTNDLWECGAAEEQEVSKTVHMTLHRSEHQAHPRDVRGKSASWTEARVKPDQSVVVSHSVAKRLEFEQKTQKICEVFVKKQLY